MRFVILTNADIGLYKFRKELIEMLCSENEVYIILPRGELIAFINYMKRTVGEEEFRRLDNLNNFGFDWEEED